MVRANELSSRESGQWPVSRRTKSTKLGRAEQIAWEMLLEAQRIGSVVPVEALVIHALRRSLENSGNADSVHHLIRRLRNKLPEGRRLVGAGSFGLSESRRVLNVRF